MRAAVLMCHAPIVLPAIGRNRAALCAATTQAMRETARSLRAAAPARLVVVSPHAPRHARCFGLLQANRVEGTFEGFGQPDIGATFPSDPDAAGALLAALPQELKAYRADGIDHGALVPLWFMAEAGLHIPVTVLALPWEATPEHHRTFGRQLAAVMDGLDPSWALLASGDMSHALQPGGPGGFHPEAHRFDATVVACVRAGRLEDMQHIDPDLRTCAREDVVDSLEVAAGALEGRELRPEVLSYEGPFGVGYLEARLV